MEENDQVPEKLIDIVQVKLVREKTIPYKERCIRSPHDAYKIFQELVGESVDRLSFRIEEGS